MTKTRLELAKSKLERLEKEQNERYTSAIEELRTIPFGQPNIRGRRDIYKNTNRNFDKFFKLIPEIEQQESRIVMLENVEAFKSDNKLLKDVHVVGKTEYATIGAKTSVNNLAYFKDQLKKLEQKNIEAKSYNRKRAKGTNKKKTYGADITKLKNKIEYLERLQEKSKNDMSVISEKAQELINSGKVNQWKKKPIYFFVKGLRKVALEINSETGDFKISQRYAPQNETDTLFVESLLK